MRKKVEYLICNDFDLIDVVNLTQEKTNDFIEKNNVEIVNISTETITDHNQVSARKYNNQSFIGYTTITTIIYKDLEEINER